MSAKKVNTDYLVKHAWARKELQKKLPLRCTKCGSTDNIDVASTNNHEYSWNIDDYTFLCRGCHKDLDSDGGYTTTHPSNVKPAERIKTYSTGKTWPVGTRKYSISYPSVDIALKYGKNVSRGIQEMEKIILKLSAPTIVDDPPKTHRCLVRTECDQYKKEGVTSRCIGCGSLVEKKATK